MTDNKRLRLVISILSILVFGHVAAQNGHEGKQDKTIDIDKSVYIDNQIKAEKRRFLANSNAVKERCDIFPLRVAVKTNLLYWTGLMPDFNRYSFLPNVELEWFIRDRWSVGLSGAFSKWNTRGDKFFGVSSWSIEPRYWFGEINDIEFYGGLYMQAGDFDNQKLHIDDFGNTGTFWGTGLSFGIYIPKWKQWGVEVGFRTGYEHRLTDVYGEAYGKYFREYTKTSNRWRITGVNLSVSYRFWERYKR